MAIAEVGSGSQRATKVHDAVDSSTLAFPANVAAGSLLVVAGSIYGGTALPTGVGITDTRTTSYTVAFSGVNTATNQVWFMGYGLAPSGGANTVTVAPTGTTGNYFGYAIDEFSGLHATPIDVSGSIASATNSAPSASVTPTVANALLIGVMSYATGVADTITAGGSYTLLGEEEDNLNHAAYSAVFRLVTTAQAYTVDWSLIASLDWEARAWAFKEATGGGTTPIAGADTNPVRLAAEVARPLVQIVATEL